jgi:hypothetical protein
MDTTTRTVPDRAAAPAMHRLLAVCGLALEVVAVAAVSLDGHRFAWIAWLPGWVGLGLALLGARAHRSLRIGAVVTAALFVVGTVLGVAPAVR